jgi:hypothetical protein
LLVKSRKIDRYKIRWPQKGSKFTSESF